MMLEQLSVASADFCSEQHPQIMHMKDHTKSHGSHHDTEFARHEFALHIFTFLRRHFAVIGSCQFEALVLHIAKSTASTLWKKEGRTIQMRDK